MPGKRPVIVTRTGEDVRAVARILGHDDVEIYETRNGWAYSCACGFVSKSLHLQSETARLAADHIVSSVTELDRWAREHGVSPGTALGYFAVDPAELELTVSDRIESRRAAG